MCEDKISQTPAIISDIFVIVRWNFPFSCTKDGLFDNT